MSDILELELEQMAVSYLVDAGNQISNLYKSNKCSLVPGSLRSRNIFNNTKRNHKMLKSGCLVGTGPRFDVHPSERLLYLYSLCSLFFDPQKETLCPALPESWPIYHYHHLFFVYMSL